MSSVEAIAPAGVDAAGEAGAKPKRSKKLLMIITAAVLLLGGGGAAAYVFLLGGKLPGGGGEAEPAVADAPPPVFFDMPEIVLRLEGGQGPYLKLGTVLDLADGRTSEEIKAVAPRLLDSMQTYLIELKPDDIKGTAGLYRMRQELLRRVNDLLPGSTRDVLFSTVILQ